MAQILESLRFYDDIYAPIVQKRFYDMLRDEEYPREDIISWMMQVDSKRREIQYGQFQRMKQEPARKYEWKDPRKADGIPILAREGKNIVKVNHRSHTPFERSIVTNKKSYFIGQKPDIEASPRFEQWMQDNRFHSLLSEITEDSVSQGEGFALLYSPPGINEAFITKEQPYNCVLIYDPDSGRPAYGLVYMYDTSRVVLQESISIQSFFYDELTVTEYEGNIYAAKPVSEPVPHLFNGVPLIEWRNNSERISDIEPVLGLMDHYDTMDSDLLSELSQLRLAYLFLKGMGLGDAVNNDSEISLTERIQETGYFATDEQDAEMDFISKSVNHEAVQYAKQSLKERIYQGGNSYDPVSVQGSDANVTAFQIRMKLFPLEQSTVETEIHFTQAFLYMYELLSDFYSSFDSGLDGDAMITFKRNIPSNTLADILQARQAGFNMSQNQLAMRLPFQIDQEENAREVEQEMNSQFIEMDGIIGDNSDDRE